MDYTLLYPGILIFLGYAWWYSRALPPHSKMNSKSQELCVIKKEQHQHASNNEFENPCYAWGRYKQPIINPNIQTKSIFGDVLKDFRLKRWHYLSVTTPTHLVAVAIVQIGYVANVWCYVFNPADKAEPLKEFRILAPLGSGVEFATSSCGGTTEWKSGENVISINSDDDSYDVNINVTSKGNTFKGNFEITKSRKSMALLYPLETPSNATFPRAAYTHKSVGMKAKGNFSYNDKQVSLDGGLGCMDWTKSFAKRETKWKWVNFSAKVNDNGVTHDIGLNLSSDVYEDTENVLFVDGKLYPQAGMTVSQIAPKEFSIKTANGYIDLVFTLVDSKEENVNALIIKDRFMQACGWYSGSIVVAKEGRETKSTLLIEKCLGVYEDHYALW